MKSYDEWKEEIEFEIARIKIRNGKIYYGFSLEMSQETEQRLVSHFRESGYVVLSRRCPRGLYDITIDI